jgi:hypothetical protein
MGGAVRVALGDAMYTKQISVFLENKKGRLAEITKLLSEEGLDIRAMSLADTEAFGVLRLIVNDHARGLAVLRDHDWAAQETEVLALEIQDTPGSLHRVVELLDRQGVNVEYLYTFFGKKGDNVLVVFKADSAEGAVKALSGAGIPLLSEDAIRKL